MYRERCKRQHRRCLGRIKTIRESRKAPSFFLSADFVKKLTISALGRATPNLCIMHKTTIKIGKIFVQNDEEKILKKA